MLYLDRTDAGRQLATHLAEYAQRSDAIVLALPRGGVPVAFEVADALKLRLDVFLVRKLALPWLKEFAIGAIASGGVRVVNAVAAATMHLPPAAIDVIAARELRELERRERAYRGDRPQPDVAGRTVILVDDGLATGSTMRAAVEGLRKLRPARIVVAVPVATAEACAELSACADRIVCAHTPDPFHGVGAWYADFTQTTDDEVRALLQKAQHALT